MPIFRARLALIVGVVLVSLPSMAAAVTSANATTTTLPPGNGTNYFLTTTSPDVGPFIDPQRGFLCEEIPSWKANGPSKKNDLASCFTNAGHMQEYAMSPARLVPMILGGLAFVISLLMCPCFCCFLCCRYCCGCCGGTKRRPDGCCCGDSKWDQIEDQAEIVVTKEYGKCSVYGHKIAAFIVLLMGIAAMIVTLVGVGALSDGNNALFAGVNSVFDLMLGILDNVNKGMTVNGKLLPPLTPETFGGLTNSLNNLKSQVGNIKYSIDPYVNLVVSVATAVAIIPVGSLCVTMLCALCNFRQYILCLNGCVHCFCIIIYGGVGGLLLIFSVTFVDLATESNKFLMGKPGLIGYGLVPMVEGMIDFDGLRTSIQQAETLAANAGCGAMVSICTPTGVYNPLKPNVVYQCNVTNGNQCSSLPQLQGSMDAMLLMQGTPVFCLEGPPSNCTVDHCSTTCSDPVVRQTSVNIVEQLGVTKQIQYVLNTFVFPFLNVNRLLFEVFRRMKVINYIAMAFQMLGAGLVMFVYIFLIDICVIYRGTKRFASLEGWDDVQIFSPAAVGADPNAGKADNGGYGQQQPVPPPGVYGQQNAAYGQPQDNAAYGQPVVYGQPNAAYGQPQPAGGYGQPQGNAAYGQPNGAYGQPQGNAAYGQPDGGYGQAYPAHPNAVPEYNAGASGKEQPYQADVPQGGFNGSTKDRDIEMSGLPAPSGAATGSQPSVDMNANISPAATPVDAGQDIAVPHHEIVAPSGNIDGNNAGVEVNPFAQSDHADRVEHQHDAGHHDGGLQVAAEIQAEGHATDAAPAETHSAGASHEVQLGADVHVEGGAGGATVGVEARAAVGGDDDDAYTF